MYYETTIKRPVEDKNGIIKEVTEKYICDDCSLFSEAEMKMYEYFNNQCDVTAVKRSPIKEFANNKDKDSDIYIATITYTFVNDSGNESKSKYKVALYASSVADANRETQEYMKQGLSDMECERIEKTSFLEVI